MAGMTTFKVTVYHTNTDVLPELANKAKNLTNLFEQIIDEWAKGNVEKFGFGVGQSSSGALIDPQVSWKALSPQYLERKTREGYADELMVRTGSLKRALTDPNGFFRMTTPEQAVFGTPNDGEDVMKMQANWLTRQTVFLSDSDQNMIRQLTDKYFTIQMRSTKEEVSQMNVDFANTVSQ